MIKAHLLTGLAWTAPITLDCDIRGDIIRALDEHYWKVGRDGFPVKLYETTEVDEEDIENYIPINGGEYWIQGISHIEVIDVDEVKQPAQTPDDYKDQLYAEVKEIVGVYIPEIVLQRMRAMGYFTAPASHKYHGAFPGGLCVHSLNVTRILLRLTRDNKLKWKRPESPIIIGLMHDLCKMDTYIEVPDWKGEGDRYTFTPKERMELQGHGDKSIGIAALLGIELTNEEQLCIRWHMGYTEPQRNWGNYNAAMQKCPNLPFVNLADVIASQIEEAN